MPKRILTGRVKSDKMDKTRVVQIARLVRHPKYGKIYRDRTTCYVHDENNESKEGDTVQIIESAPFSNKQATALELDRSHIATGSSSHPPCAVRSTSS